MKRAQIDQHDSPLELLQEAQIVAPKIANILDVVLEHRDPFWPHAEREAAVNFRVIAAVAQHRGMDHATARDLKPACVLAHRTAFAVAQDTLDVYFHARLGEREVRATKPYFVILA